MRIAITGATGFVGTHLINRLEPEGHELVTDLSDVSVLRESLAGCQVVAHCAESRGTRNVVEAAKSAGVEKIVLMSRLRARPQCGSAYHESKWEAEELVRNSGLDYTIIKAGVVYGRGDHMLDRLSRALHTFPVFGLKEKTIRPLAVEDLVHVMRAALVDRRLKRQTIALLGPEEIYLSEAVRRVAEVMGRRPLIIRLPFVCEQLVSPGSPVVPVPYDLVPTRRFTPEQIRNGLPQKGTKNTKWLSSIFCAFCAFLWHSLPNGPDRDHRRWHRWFDRRTRNSPLKGAIAAARTRS